MHLEASIIPGMSKYSELCKDSLILHQDRAAQRAEVLAEVPQKNLQSGSGRLSPAWSDKSPPTSRKLCSCPFRVTKRLQCDTKAKSTFLVEMPMVRGWLLAQCRGAGDKRVSF